MGTKTEGETQINFGRCNAFSTPPIPLSRHAEFATPQCGASSPLSLSSPTSPWQNCKIANEALPAVTMEKSHVLGTLRKITQIQLTTYYVLY